MNKEQKVIKKDSWEFDCPNDKNCNSYENTCGDCLNIVVNNNIKIDEMKTKYNQLREEIIKTNKDIVALKFGCKVISQIKDGTQKFENIIVGDKIIGTTHYPVSYNTSVNEDQIIKIIGRPISLEDVMIAISKKQGEWGIRFWGNGVIRLDENITWRPNKPLQDQSNECKELLFNLIVKK